MGSFKDMTGKKFGKLTVLKRSGTFYEGAIGWLCRCSCGNTKRVVGESLKSGNTKSCGCIKKDLPGKNHNPDRVGICEVCKKVFPYKSYTIRKTCSRDCFKVRMCTNRKKDFKSYLRSLCQQVRYKSKRLHILCNITLDYLMGLFNKQEGRCKLTGIPFYLCSGLKKRQTSPWSASLDRINPSKGYVIGNVQLVCYMYNMAKNQWSDSDVIKFSKALVLNKYNSRRIKNVK